MIEGVIGILRCCLSTVGPPKYILPVVESTSVIAVPSHVYI